MTKLILAFLVAGSTTVFAKSGPNAAFIEIRPGVELFVEHHPAAPGRPTVFLANGLTYSTKQYDDYVEALRKLDPGIGIVAWDMRGMGKTLLKYGPQRERVLIEDQAKDLRDLVKKLNITGAKSLMGLSYGGALKLLYSTLHPDEFDHYIGFAPLVERVPAQDLYLQRMVRWHRMMFPFDRSSDDEIYDHYLKDLVYRTFWLAEPIILENPYKLDAVFRMVQGVKNFNAFSLADRFPRNKIHLIAAKNDEHVKLDRLNEFWATVPESARASYLRLDHSTHKIPEAWPHIAASWTLHILSNHPDLHRGLIFEGDPYKAEAKHGAIRIPLNKAGNCEPLLGKIPEQRTR